MKTTTTALGALLLAGAAAAEPSLERGTYLVEGPMACGNCHHPFGDAGFEEVGPADY